jgi:23S rRNA (cytidine1920-2'-O)/16S rRNA (cytidine1409-2'-O)-methyltransferase
LVDLVTVDLSFISLSLVLPLLPPFLRPRGQVLALIKPEFEVGRAYVGRGGIVRDFTHRKLAVCRVLEAALGVGFQVVQTTDALRWQKRGNQEVFAYLGWSQ